MEPLLERIAHRHFWSFHGGIHPPEQKFLTNDKPIRHISMAKQYLVPLQQHIGSEGQLLVSEGQRVLKGQPLTSLSNPMAVPVHAPTSGTISAIKKLPSSTPSALPQTTVVIEADGKDQWRERHYCGDFRLLSKMEILNKVAHAGIAGMGGAGFPTHVKASCQQQVEFLIINAAECEPYITADDLLMREQAATIVEGIKILCHLLNPKMVLVGIEDNKPLAIKAMEIATEHLSDVEVCQLPTIYPTGGEKQLIKILTGREISSGKLPIHQGIVMQNVATCYAIAEAVLNDTPLIERVVTVTGKALENPQNLWVKIGTPIEHLLSQCGYDASSNEQLIMGGPMMGFTLPSDKLPVIKTTNCIIAPSVTEIPLPEPEQECIRCGQCAEVCPAQLLPQELQWSAKAKDTDKLEDLNLFDCIECGACAYVCPSHIPLVHYYRVAKADIRNQKIQQQKAEKAKLRFEARKQRLEQQKLERELKHKQAAEARKAKMAEKSADGTDAKSAVAAALARVKAKKQAQDTSKTPSSPNAQPNASNQVTEEITDNTAQSDKKAQVSAAIARAKAKKQAAQQTQQVQQASNLEVEAADNEKKEDIQKAKVAAAVAKAKAKKQVKENQTEQETSTEVEATASNAEQQKQQKINAAIEKAKAKAKARQSSSESSSVIDDEKQKRIAAAIAKAKAKKQQAGTK